MPQKCVNGHLTERDKYGSCPTCRRAQQRKAKHAPQYVEKRRAWDRGRKARNPLVYSWTNYRRNAKGKGLMFELTRQEHDSLVVKPCDYCGSVADPINGLDRIDNQSGYLPENVVPCCKTCNFMRGLLSREAFVQQVLRIAEMRG